MNRRTLIKYFSAGIAGTGLGVCCPSLISSARERKGEIHWGYVGEDGPEKWGEISPDFKACQLGMNQSPIDLQPAIKANISPIKVSYKNSTLRIINNGHTVQVNYAPGSSLILDDQTFNLVQFHFHHPSEHRIGGRNYDMEAHLVHRNADGALAVLGIFLKQGQPNAALQPIWQAIPMQKGTEQTIPGVVINIEKLLPTDRSFYRYFGSLTTPPCSEGVNWLVLKQPVELSREQIQRFTKAVPMDARPIQKLNQRFLLQSS